MTTQSVGQTAQAAFSERLIGLLVGGRLSLMISIGHRTGLFDAMAQLPPSTSAEIAESADMNERYVREWLGAMVAGRIVEYVAARRLYRLPPEHAAVLTRAAGLRNMAVPFQAVAHFGMVEDAIVECFRSGGGVPYSAYPGFQRFLSEWSGRVYDAALIDRILPLVPGLIERLAHGIEVADIGCGSGHAINLMARAFPRSRFIGFDISDDGLTAARAEAEEMGLTNARFELRDVATLSAVDAYDFITAFDAIHDQVHPREVLQRIAAALRQDGVFLMVDAGVSSNLEENMSHPLAASFYTNSTMYCLAVSLAQGGEGLGAMWGEQMARELLAEAGFTQVTAERIDGDLVNNYYIASKR